MTDILLGACVVLLVGIAWMSRRLAQQGAQQDENLIAVAQRVEDIRSDLSLQLNKFARRSALLGQQLLSWRAVARSDMSAKSLQDFLHWVQVGLIGVVRQISNNTMRDDQMTTEVRIPNPFSALDHPAWVSAVGLWVKHGQKLIPALPDRDCPACQSSDHRLIFESYDGYPFHACRKCGTWFVSKHVDSALFEKFFAECPSAGELAEKIVQQRLTSERVQHDRDRIGTYLRELAPFIQECSAGKTYLDIGCGLGYSLEVAKELGFEAHGIEVDKQSVEIARQKGLTVSLPGAELPKASFSLISLWETIEHLDNPRAVLEAALPALAPGGVLALTFPNLNSPMIRFLKSDCIWVHGGVNTPGHVNLFHLPAIERLLDSLGMCVLDVDGQFGTNTQELMLYSVGQHRGISDFLNGSDRVHHLSQTTLRINETIGPPLALAERALLLSPILQVFACRKEEKPRFHHALEKARETRAAQILADAEQMMPDFAEFIGTMSV